MLPAERTCQYPGWHFKNWWLSQYIFIRSWRWRLNTKFWLRADTGILSLEARILGLAARYTCSPQALNCSTERLVILLGICVHFSAPACNSERAYPKMWWRAIIQVDDARRKDVACGLHDSHLDNMKPVRWHAPPRSHLSRACYACFYHTNTSTPIVNKHHSLLWHIRVLISSCE